MRGDNFLGLFRGNVGVKYPGLAGQLHVHQGFGKAETEAPDLADLGGGIMPFQRFLQTLYYRIGARRLAAQGRPYPNPGAVAGGQRLPTLFGLGLKFLKG